MLVWVYEARRDMIDGPEVWSGIHKTGQKQGSSRACQQTASWKDPSLLRDAYVPQARLMVIPSSWATTPVACRSKDSALAIHRPPTSHYTPQLHRWLHAACKPPSQVLI